MKNLLGPRKVLILEDDRRTMGWLVTAAIERPDRLKVVWARTLEEALDALSFYGERLAFIVLSDTITDGPTVDFARHVQTAGFDGLKIRIGSDRQLALELERASFCLCCPRIELPSHLLNLITTSFSPPFVPPPP